MRSFLSDESGQGLVEYAVILGLLAIVAVGVLLMLGGNVDSQLRDPLDSRDAPLIGPGGGATGGTRR